MLEWYQNQGWRRVKTPGGMGGGKEVLLVACSVLFTDSLFTSVIYTVIYLPLTSLTLITHLT